MISAQKLQSIVEKKKNLEEKLASGAVTPDQFASLSKEYSDIEPIALKADILLSHHEEKADLKSMLEEGELDEDMLALVQDDLARIEKEIPEFESELQIMLLPKDEADSRNAILEVRAGTGGDEAALFAGSLFRMYQRYSELQGWKLSLMSVSDGEVGGYKEVIATISGKDVFANLKFESGVHRVQRVPETESGGRIHTSAATVAVLPEAEEVDIEIEDKDIRVDVYRASGPGGQSVNTTDSAVRITHLPTGLIVTQQDEKSQHKNRAKAMKVLRSRLYEMERQKLADERAQSRKGQVGSGDRSERIRTYNFPQGRVTDHRINLTLYKLDQVVAGDGLHELIHALQTEDIAQQLAAVNEE